MNNRIASGLVLLTTLMWQGLIVAHAQPVVDSTAPTNAPAGPTPIDMTADRLEYESDISMLIGMGNVEVRHLGDYLRADYLEVNTETQDVYARGNVFLDQSGTEWEGEELRYNLKTKQGQTGSFKVFSDPYYVTADDSERRDENHLKLENARLTSCEGEDPIFYIRARDAVLVDGKKLKARNMTLHYMGVPFFYLPYMVKNLDHSNWDFLPGYGSRQGAFLLTKYNYDITPNVRGAVRLDVRGNRGVGVGKDFVWNDYADSQYTGEFNAYYIDDSDPLDGAEDEAAFGSLVDSERYRLRLKHRQNVTPNDYVTAEFNYLSDPLVLEDFFDEEFRHNSQPENRASLTHRDDYFTAGGEVSVRLNDFYENVNRLPEIYLDVQRQQVYETDVYYESENTAGFYEKVFKDSSSRTDYDAFRADSKHTVLYPTRHFGWLNVIPRAGYRGTYYSATRESSTVTNMVSMTDTNGVTTMTNEVSTLVMDKGGALRSLFEFGVETSFKAFKELHDQPTIFGNGLRHVAEPFTGYTYSPTPNLERNELPQFDRIDRLGGGKPAANRDAEQIADQE